MSDIGPTPAIYERLAAVMADVRSVAKADQNQAQNFRFRGIDSVLNAVGPALRNHQVLVVPMVEDVEASTVEVGRNRTPMGHVRVTVTYRFFAMDGSHLDAVVPGEAFDAGDKAVSKAMSVAFRTALIQSLALPTDDVDPDAVSYERAGSTVPEVDVFDELRQLTHELADPAPVIEWVKAERITRGTLTDDLVEQWRGRIALATPTPDDGKGDPF